MTRCFACQIEDAPVERGVALCRECTRRLAHHFANPNLGVAKIEIGRTYADACDVCGEHRSRRILVHPEWGRVCEVDVHDAAEIHGLPLP